MKRSLCMTILGALFLAGCSTSSENAGARSPFAARYRTDDGRTIRIGASSESEGGWQFRNPLMEECWIADGFNFTNYDTLYIAPVESTATFEDDEATLHQWARATLPVELRDRIIQKAIFRDVVTNEPPAQPARVLRMENTITEYTKGGGAARFWAGEFGAGQPVLRVRGQLVDGNQVVFRYDMRRSGATTTGRMFGGSMRDEEIQIKDIRSLTLDLTDFMAAISGKYTPGPLRRSITHPRLTRGSVP